VNAIKSISVDINRVWPGAWSFWHITCFMEQQSPDGTYYTGFMEVDPQPATINAPLGSSSTTAAATYVNTATTTTAHFWPGSWTIGSKPAGAPCSPGDVPNGTVLTSTIQAAGNYRKCM
jgi:hypothetical protein